MQIEIPDSLFKRLQKHAVPLVDTTAAIIKRLLDRYENDLSQANFDNPVTVPDVVRQLNPTQTPSLLHSRVHGEFNGIPFSNWNDLLRVAHVEAFKKAKSFEALRSATLAQIKKGRYEEEGYRYIDEIGISLQGVDANRAWQYGFRLGVYLRVPLQAEVIWRHNPKAVHPGERAVLAWAPAE